MDGKKQEHHMSYGRATAAVASGAAQWEIEEGKALCIDPCSFLHYCI